MIAIILAAATETRLEVEVADALAPFFPDASAPRDDSSGGVGFSVKFASASDAEGRVASSDSDDGETGDAMEASVAPSSLLTHGQLEALQGIPKALFPVGDLGKPILAHLLDTIEKRSNGNVTRVFVVTSAAKYKYFERFATSRGIGVEFVVNNGVTTPECMLGSARDLQLGLKRAKRVLGMQLFSEQDIMVVAGDSLFYKTFDVGGVINFYKMKQPGNLLLYCSMAPEISTTARGVVIVDPKTKKVLAFREKPDPESWDAVKASISKNVGDANQSSPLFYIIRSEDRHHVDEFVEQNAEGGASTLGVGKMIEYMAAKTVFFGMRLPSAFALIGHDAGLEQYVALDATFRENERASFDSARTVQAKAFARVGIMGNPSDGYFGKTLGLSVRNFWATVKLQASKNLELVPNPLYDCMSYGSLAALYSVTRREGYQGGMRLLMATVKRFYEYCTNNGIALPKRNFTASYETNIPRQVGLAGSSAIVTAFFRALMTFYGLNEFDIPKFLQPSFVLSVEEELGINAGLQDRVVQTYEGLTYMNFEQEHMEKKGYGLYRELDASLVDGLQFFIAYENDPSDSGKIHSDVRRRWLNGEVEVRNAMLEFGVLTDNAVDAMKNGDVNALMALMSKNFACRRNLFGDACLGATNLRMIELGESNGAAVKFPGSGGAIVGLCQHKSHLKKLRNAYEGEGFIFAPLLPNFPSK